jgi:hypothetical protein
MYKYCNKCTISIFLRLDLMTSPARVNDAKLCLYLDACK